MLYPALRANASDSDRVLAIVDDYSPTAVDDSEALRVFFASASTRDAARHALSEAGISATSIDVDDENWARKSQAGLKPVTVGRVTVASRQSSVASHQSSIASLIRNPQSEIRNPKSEIRIVIVPSMGFGTGHHATTRLCLEALQTLDLAGARVVDVGTGSGVLAIAAVRLGAAHALGIDTDPDAVRAAEENLDLNPEARGVEFVVADITHGAFTPADVVTANLTGALLVRSAEKLTSLLRPGGTLIVSGLMREERNEVRAAFSALEMFAETSEDEWVALTLVEKSG